MLVKLVLLATLMASFIGPSIPSQYTLPVSVPVRFDLPGNYVDVRRSTISGNITADIGHHGGTRVARLSENGHHRKRERKAKEQSVLQDEFYSGHKRRRNRFNKRGNKTYGRLPKKNINNKSGIRNRGRKTNAPNRKSNAPNRKSNAPNRKSNAPNRKSNAPNRKSNAPNRKTNSPNRKSNSPNRKSNAPNRPGGGWPAGGRYRSVDPRQKKVRRHILRVHNILRSHVVPPAADMLAVGWYETAGEQAQAWAEQCGAHTDSDHPSVRWTSRYGACGQNVLVAARKRRWSYVLRRWWSGRRYFRFGDEANNSSVVSAYTQMAWYNSHQLGCGFAECSTTGGSTFFRYVCNYCPSGNDPRRLSRPYTHGQSCRRCPNSCRSMCSRGQCKLCTNACTYSDLWVNCATLNKKWHEWLCNTKTSQGVERFKNCRATCQCMKRIT